ncbi:MAG: tRNA (adenosine(37)-N6)-threonylcarbamoyltransferase complex ATPase subunit type 1 TsaE, partial [Myxococcota bacterium]
TGGRRGRARRRPRRSLGGARTGVRSWRSTSIRDTEEVGRQLAAELAPDGVLLLFGGLGAGKTALVRGLAAGLGIDAAEVQSPTYTLMREHFSGVARLVHVDLYRLEPAEVAAAGIEEALYGPGVKAVEWAERLPHEPEGALALEIERGGSEPAGEQTRELAQVRTIRERRPAAVAPAPR